MQPRWLEKPYRRWLAFCAHHDDFQQLSAFFCDIPGVWPAILHSYTPYSKEERVILGTLGLTLSLELMSSRSIVPVCPSGVCTGTRRPGPWMYTRHRRRLGSSQNYRIVSPFLFLHLISTHPILDSVDERSRGFHPLTLYIAGRLLLDAVNNSTKFSPGGFYRFHHPHNLYIRITEGIQQPCVSPPPLHFSSHFSLCRPQHSRRPKGAVMVVLEGGLPDRRKGPARSL